MRDALRREYGYLTLALICAALIIAAGAYAHGAYNGAAAHVDDFRPPVSALIDINRAEVPMLVSLPGVGEKLAQRIIDGRPYADIEELRDVQGISEAMFQKLKDRICVTDIE